MEPREEMRKWDISFMGKVKRVKGEEEDGLEAEDEGEVRIEVFLSANAANFTAKFKVLRSNLLCRGYHLAKIRGSENRFYAGYNFYVFV